VFVSFVNGGLEFPLLGALICFESMLKGFSGTENWGVFVSFVNGGLEYLPPSALICSCAALKGFPGTEGNLGVSVSG